jgi:hypothetical protein
MIETLIRAIRNHEIILFVGSGVSKPLGLPSWDELIEKMGSDLDFDPKIFKEYANYLQLAEYYQLKKTSLGNLRSWMDRTWHQDEAKIDASSMHDSIVKLRCPIIYTTNYDRWLEIAFARRNEPFTKIANVGDFANLRDKNTQIVKLHGDFEDDESLVLTENSYFERLAFESPLDLKLRSDSIGSGMLFIGYSLSDINVRYLLYKLKRLWEGSRFSSVRPKSFMFLTRPNPIQQEILEQRGILPIVSTCDDPTEGLTAFLKKLVEDAFGMRG